MAPHLTGAKPSEAFSEFERKAEPSAISGGILKKRAVKRVLSGHAVTAVARELRVGDRLIHNGRARHRQQAGAGAVQAEPAAEIARIKRRLIQREEEVAILK